MTQYTHKARVNAGSIFQFENKTFVKNKNNSTYNNNLILIYQRERKYRNMYRECFR